MSIELSPEDINRYVADVIVKSAIGEALKKVIDKTVNELASAYNNPFEHQIKQVIALEIERIVREEFATQIKEKAAERVRAHITEGVLDAILNKAVRAATDAIDGSKYR